MPTGINEQISNLYENESGMDAITLVGFIAGALTTVAYVPQVIRSWKLKEIARHLALPCCALRDRCLSRFVYGVWSDALPIIAANGISLVLILVLLGIKLRYR